MNASPQPYFPATIRMGGAAKWVSVPPTETFTKRRPSVPYFRRGEGSSSKRCRARRSAQIVMAAGSVMKEPRSGPIVRIAAHQASGVLPPRPATAPMHLSAKERTGRVEAIAMMTTTNIGSVKWTFATKPSTVRHPFIATAVRRSGIAQMPKTASTSPRKWRTSTRKLCPSPPFSFSIRCWRR